MAQTDTHEPAAAPREGVFRRVGDQLDDDQAQVAADVAPKGAGIGAEFAVQPARRQVRGAEFLAQPPQMGRSIERRIVRLLPQGPMHAGEGLDAAGEHAHGVLDRGIGELSEVAPQQAVERGQGVEEPMVRLPRDEPRVGWSDGVPHGEAPLP